MPYCAVNGIKIYYESFGEGRPLLEEGFARRGGRPEGWDLAAHMPVVVADDDVGDEGEMRGIGVRLDGNQFTTNPNFNPAVEQAFGDEHRPFDTLVSFGCKQGANVVVVQQLHGALGPPVSAGDEEHGLVSIACLLDVGNPIRDSSAELLPRLRQVVPGGHQGREGRDRR